tara:strand:+ start:29 stop:412 length:384 start_codon:yes stop_codon:yes gene_type:complete
MRDLKDIIRRAMKNGFDLSFVKNYNERALLQGLYDFLIKNHYYCSMDRDVIYVGSDIIEDTAEVRIKNKTMFVKVLTERGFFDTLVTLFKYVKHLADQLEEEDSEEDVSTETDELQDDDDSSEELWL